MRVVVLDAFEGQVQLHRVLGGQVLRVQVVGHDLRVDVEQPAEVLDALGERAQGLGVLQVPDVLRDEGVAAPGQAERVLQLGAAGQHRAGEGAGGRDGLGDVAAGAPDQHRAAAERPGHRVVGPDVDGPVVSQERVRYPAEPVPRLVVPVDDRLVGDVSAGQDDRAGYGGEQQVVQRGVRQHDAELAVGRGRGGGDGGISPPGEQHDRAGLAGQQVGGRGVDLGQLPAAAARSAAMTANGLSSRCLRWRSAATAGSQAASAARW